MTVEIGTEPSSDAGALEGFGGMEGGEAGQVLGQTFFGQIPALANIDVIGVGVYLDDVQAISARTRDDPGAGDEVEAELEVVAVAAEVVVEDVIAV